jgi:hypothetical protein
MYIYEILPALDMTQSVHAKIYIGMHRGVKFKISRIPFPTGGAGILSVIRFQDGGRRSAVVGAEARI